MFDSGFDIAIRGSDSSFRFSTDTLLISRTAAISRLQHSMAVTSKLPDGVSSHTIYVSRQPSMDVTVGKRQYRLGAGQALAIAPGLTYAGRWRDLDCDTVVLDQALLQDQAAGQLEAGQLLRLDFDVAVSRVANDHWCRTVGLVRRIALANADRPDSTLLADQLGRLLAGAALTCFPNPTLATTTTPRAATPASLRRATAYIDDHLDQPVTLADVAAAAGVSARSLHETFRRHLDTTPMAYLRRGRLARAHRDLRNAQPGDGQTVTGIAARWGFYSLPRFGVTYRRSYATTPSHTLRQA